jgi:1,4-alpha-glucan branching enzyme
VFRVWAPHADFVELVCLSNGKSDVKEKVVPMTRLFDGESFEARTKASEGDKYRYCIHTRDGRKLYKSDPYSFRTDIPQSHYSIVYDIQKIKKSSGIFVTRSQPVNIYEVSLLSWKRHEDNSYYTYSDLERELVPYVKEMGYTHVEFMPITEFPFDGSWGYQVTGYFSVTARLGTPTEFVSLVNAFHREGIAVICDWVPAHFPKDDWALYEFDGQPLYECPLWDRMEHLGWGTRRFDFGRGEVDSFLLSSATYLVDTFGIDGLRVDAVASMLYLDYDRKAYEWTPNKFGDNRNLQAIEFIKKLNSSIKGNFPNVLMIAEDSTCFEGVTRCVEEGGLGFDYKWNMGWMNDTLFYCRQDPYFRAYHHEKLTFSLMYAFSESFILPLSHDEVVHVKGSIVNKMPGSYEDKFAGERAMLGYMYAHPGKKLNFMGYEISQFDEWNYSKGIQFDLTKYEKHCKMRVFVKNINSIYKNYSPLYEIEDSWQGFEWLVVDDRQSNVIAFNRYSRFGQTLTAIINFSGIDLCGYRIGIDKGSYKLILNTDDAKFGGEGKIKKKIYKTRNQTSNGKEQSITVDIPKLTCMYLIKT